MPAKETQEVAAVKNAILDREARAKVGAFTDAYINAHASRRGRDRAEIIREILDQWAMDQHDIFTLAQDQLKREGI